MKTTNEIKRFFKDKFNLKVVGNTSSGRGQWQSFRIRPEPCDDVRAPLVYKSEFPVEFRQRCIRAVYPDHPQLCAQTTAGNVMTHSIALRADQWEQVIREETEIV